MVIGWLDVIFNFVIQMFRFSVRMVKKRQTKITYLCRRRRGRKYNITINRKIGSSSLNFMSLELKIVRWSWSEQRLNRNEWKKKQFDSKAIDFSKTNLLFLYILSIIVIISFLEFFLVFDCVFVQNCVMKGDKNVTIKYIFLPKNWMTLSKIIILVSAKENQKRKRDRKWLTLIRR